MRESSKSIYPHSDQKVAHVPDTFRSTTPAATSLETSSYAAIFEHAPQVMFVIDRDMVVHDANRKGVEFARCQREELLGRRLGEILISIRDSGFHENCALGIMCDNCAIHVALQDSLTSGHPHFDLTIPSSEYAETGSRERYVIRAISRIQDSPVPLALVSLEARPTEQPTGGSLTDVGFGFFSAFETHHAVMLLIDPVSGSIVDANEAAARFYGYSRRNLKALNIADINTMTPEQITLERLRALEQERNSFVFPHRLASGERRTVEVRSSPVTVNDRLLLLSIVHDITGHSQAEEALAQKQAQLHGLTESLPGIIFQFFAREDGVWGFHYLSGKTQDILGLPKEIENPLEAFSSRLDPRDVARFQESVRIAVTERTPWEFEGRFFRPNGESVWLKGISAPELRPGEVVFNGILLDVTEQKKIELELSKSEERFRLIAEGAFDVIFATDADHLIQYVSPKVETMFGYSPEQLLGRGISAIAPESEHGLLARAFAKVSGGHPVMNKMFHVIKKDGTIADAELNAVPMYRNDRLVGDIAIVRDVSETKRLHDLESRAQRLETAGKIAGQVAHDFNNLLAPIIAYPEFIRESIPESNSARNYLTVIETAANKIADINQELLTLSRRGHYTQDVLDLNALVRQVVADLGILPETLICDLELDESLMSIRGGRAQIYRVLMNLIVNARDALRDCGRIGIRTENFYVDTEIVGFGRVPRGEYARLTISDSGCGIPPDVVQRIFDPFFTTKVTDKRRGSGLGLSVVDAVVKDHGGYIDLATKDGIGTSFFIYIPVTREAKEEPITEDCPTGTERILVVDDDDIQRTVTNELLGRLGYAVTIAPSGETALELLSQESFDLLILDMIMPGGIDGAETYRRALAINSAQRAIIVSGFSETERVHMVQSIGAGDFVRKPLTRQSLARAVRREIDRVPHSQAVKA